MEFIYPAYKRPEFISVVAEIRDELNMSSFGLIDFEINPQNGNEEVATIQTDFAKKLTPEQLTKLRAVK